MKKEDFRKFAKALSDLGAAKGGKARANTLTPEERREIAKRAAEARWAKLGKKKGDKMDTNEAESTDTGGVIEQTPEHEVGPETPFSMFRGTLRFGDMDLECHVLNDGRRVFTQSEVVRVLTGGTETGNLTRYLGRNPLIGNDFSVGPIPFRIPGNPTLAIGSEATLLVEICERYLDARQQGLLKRSQLKLAIQAEIVVRTCAKVGVIALVDEATGYQRVRAKNALQLKLQAFIAEEMQEWAVMFPHEFWMELARLEGIHYSPRNRPLRWGKYVMMFAYDAIDADVGNWLRENNPSPHFLKNHHQWLKKFGREKVHDQIMQVIAVMKLCNDMSDFREKFAHVFRKSPLQLTFDDINWGEGS
jgi:hypothetical protein